MLKSIRRIFEPKPVQDMTIGGLIKIDDAQFVEQVRDTKAQVFDSDGGWLVNSKSMARPIFVPFNQPLAFGGERIIVQRSKQLEDLLDRIDGVEPA